MIMRYEGITEEVLPVGASLPPFHKSIAQADINRYAEVSGDFNPIHINLEYARNTPLGTTVAHGMLLLAYISQVMTRALGRSWLERGKLYARFKSPARPGDTIFISGKVSKISAQWGKPTVYCDIVCRNQNNEELILSKTEVQIR